MNCTICSTIAQTVTTWNDAQPEHPKPDVYSVWRCEKGHHFYTVSKWEEKHYKTDFVVPENMPLMNSFL